MRHITPSSLDRLEAFLVELRRLEGLREKKRGVFYRRSRAFLHFHEDPEGLFADVRLIDEFERFRVSSRTEQKALLVRLRAALPVETSTS
jgi:hypothetical protein